MESSEKNKDTNEDLNKENSKDTPQGATEGESKPGEQEKDSVEKEESPAKDSSKDENKGTEEVIKIKNTKSPTNDNFLMRLYKEGEVRVDSKNSVIKAKYVSEILTITDLKEKFYKETVLRNKEIIEEVSKIKNSAEEEGFKRGLSRLSDIIVKQEKTYFDVQNKLEGLVNEIAISAVKKIIDEEVKARPHIIKGVVERALAIVSDKNKIVLFVNPNDEKFISDDKDNLVKFAKKANSFRIEASEDVDIGGCIVQTEDGVLNANINDMIDRIRTSLVPYKDMWEL
ncbi:MAG: hypothetical protein KAH32_02555 [Chlamydiia bacterium]|nr:hypothetical protein [Chlamydiia bacterium]